MCGDNEFISIMNQVSLFYNVLCFIEENTYLKVYLVLINQKCDDVTTESSPFNDLCYELHVDFLV